MAKSTPLLKVQNLPYHFFLGSLANNMKILECESRIDMGKTKINAINP